MNEKIPQDIIQTGQRLILAVSVSDFIGEGSFIKINPGGLELSNRQDGIVHISNNVITQ
jgi:hypothetical protein